MPVQECEDLTWRIKNSMPKVVRFVAGLTRHVKKKGKLTNPYGRTRHFGKGGGNYSAAFNTLVQGTAADVMKRAMLRVHAAIEGTGAKLVATVHDEVILYVPNGKERILSFCKAEMERDWPFRVPMKCEVAVSSSSWGEKKELEIEELRRLAA